MPSWAWKLIGLSEALNILLSPGDEMTEEEINKTYPLPNKPYVRWATFHSGDKNESN